MRRSSTAPPPRHTRTRQSSSSGPFVALSLSTKRGGRKISNVAGTAHDPSDEDDWKHDKDVIIIEVRPSQAGNVTFSPLEVKREVIPLESPTRSTEPAPVSAQVGEGAVVHKEDLQAPKDSLGSKNLARQSPPTNLSYFSDASHPTIKVASSSSATLVPIPNSDETSSSDLPCSPDPTGSVGLSSGLGDTPRANVEPANLDLTHVSDKVSDESSHSNNAKYSLPVSLAKPFSIPPGTMEDSTASMNQEQKPKGKFSFSSSVQVRPLPIRKAPAVLEPISSTRIFPPEEPDYFQPLITSKVTTYTRKRSRSAPASKPRTVPAKRRKTAAIKKRSLQETEPDEDDPIEDEGALQDFESTSRTIARDLKVRHPTTDPTEADAIVGLLMLSRHPVARRFNSSAALVSEPSSNFVAMELPVPQQPRPPTLRFYSKGKPLNDGQQGTSPKQSPTDYTITPSTTMAHAISNIRSLLNFDQPSLYDRLAFRPATSTYRGYAMSPDSDE